MTDARSLTFQLGGRWWRRYGVAPCPVCQTEGRMGQDALTLADGRAGLLVHCKKSACAFMDILRAAGVAPGNYIAPDPAELAKRAAADKADAEKRARQAHRCWQEAKPIAGTLAETYLRKARGITCPLPLSLRFHPEAWHGPTAKRYPALIALVEGGDGFAVHRTYLHGGGMCKAALDPPRAMLGACAGGAVRLSEAQGRLVVAEGIETALSLSCGLLRGPATVWAALSTSGVRGLRLPSEAGQLTIAPDGDPPGKAAAHALAERAHATGWAVSLLLAPLGRDWNDVLMMKGERT